MLTFASVKNVANFDQNVRPYHVQIVRSNHQKWIPQIKKWSGSDTLRGII